MRCHPLDWAAGKFQKSNWLMLFITLFPKLDIDASMKPAIMVMKKNVDRESKKFSMKVKLPERISGSQASYGTLITEKNMSRLLA